jgi:dTDP-4-dehydrorhamnose reductase
MKGSQGKILIIGAKGMFGQELAKVFKDLNPLLWDKEELDITNQKQVEDIIDRNYPLELIINAAAYTDVDAAETNQELAQQVNGQAVGYLAQAASKIGTVLVHYSTDYVFDGQKKQGYQEDDQPINPVNVYGQSKLLGEKLLQVNCQKYYLIRTSGLYGSGGKNFVETILKLAQQKDKLKVVNDQYFKPTYALDLAIETRKLIERKPSFGTYHLTNEGVTNWCDFAKKICQIYFQLAGIKLSKIIPCSSKDFPRPARRPSYSILQNTKLPPLRPWREALREYLTHRFK